MLIGYLRGRIDDADALAAQRQALRVSGDRVKPSGSDIRNPATLRSRGESNWLTR